MARKQSKNKEANADLAHKWFGPYGLPVAASALSIVGTLVLGNLMGSITDVGKIDDKLHVLVTEVALVKQATTSLAEGIGELKADTKDDMRSLREDISEEVRIARLDLDARLDASQHLLTQLAQEQRWLQFRLQSEGVLFVPTETPTQIPPSPTREAAATPTLTPAGQVRQEIGPLPDPHGGD